MTQPNNPWVDPKSLGVAQREFFKPEAGKTARIHLMTPPARAFAHFINGQGFVRTLSEYTVDQYGNTRRTKDGPDIKLIGKDPQLIFCAPVLVYETDGKGAVLDPKNPKFEFRIWQFYAREYSTLFGLATEYGEEFAQKDLLVGGEKSGKYVKTTVQVAAKDAICLSPKIRERVEAEFGIYPYRNPEKEIARTMTAVEMEKVLESAETNTQAGAGSVKNTIG